MVEHNNSNYDSVYKFNGKELDESTGYYYYGARYYNPSTSIFLSVDP
jgi:RHS repeat-associated protein